jgi:hypothetical protein
MDNDGLRPSNLDLNHDREERGFAGPVPRTDLPANREEPKMSKIPSANPSARDRIEANVETTADTRAYQKPELIRIGGLNSIRYKPGNGGDHNDGTYFQYRLG